MNIIIFLLGCVEKDESIVCVYSLVCSHNMFTLFYLGQENVLLYLLIDPDGGLLRETKQSHRVGHIFFTLM